MRAALDRWSAWIAVGGVVAFALFDVVAISLADAAYDWRTDFVSSLAGRGPSVWQIEDAGLFAFALAHLATAYLLRVRWRARAAGWLATVGGACFLAVAAFRAGCPLGEAGCAVEGGHHELEDTVTALHGGLAGVYLMVMLLTMVVAGFSARRREGAARWVLLASIPIAGLAWYCLGRFGAGPDIGLWERAWLGCNAAWLLLITLTPEFFSSSGP